MNCRQFLGTGAAGLALSQAAARRTDRTLTDSQLPSMLTIQVKIEDTVIHK